MIGPGKSRHCVTLESNLCLSWNKINKLTSVFHASVLLLTMNFVTIETAQVAMDGSAEHFDNVRTKLIENRPLSLLDVLHNL